MVLVSDVLLTSDGGVCCTLMLSLLFDAICPCIVISYLPSAIRCPLCAYVMYCMCTYFSGIHILAELALNQVR